MIIIIIIIIAAIIGFVTARAELFLLSSQFH